MDYLLSRGNKKLVCAVSHNSTPQKPPGHPGIQSVETSTAGKWCQEIREKLENIKIQCLEEGTEIHMEAPKWVISQLKVLSIQSGHERGWYKTDMQIQTELNTYLIMLLSAKSELLLQNN